MPSFICVLLAFSTPSRGADPAKHPCEVIKEVCETAGFVKGQAREGTGLWKDCIEPLVQGTPQPKKAKKPLPTVDPAVIAACKAKHGMTTGK